MLIKTILNRIQKHPRFVYGDIQLWQDGDRLVLDVKIRPRATGHAICSGCCKRRPGYDTLPERRFEFVPLWGIAVFFLYALRRVSCPKCGVKAEVVPWAEGKSHLTTTYAWFLARWAKRLSWKEVAEVFHTSWDSVVRSVKMAVAWGREHRIIEGGQFHRHRRDFEERPEVRYIGLPDRRGRQASALDGTGTYEEESAQLL